MNSLVMLSPNEIHGQCHKKDEIIFMFKLTYKSNWKVQKIVYDVFD